MLRDFCNLFTSALARSPDVGLAAFVLPVWQHCQPHTDGVATGRSAAPTTRIFGSVECGGTLLRKSFGAPLLTPPSMRHRYVPLQAFAQNATFTISCTVALHPNVSEIAFERPAIQTDCSIRQAYAS